MKKSRRKSPRKSRRKSPRKSRRKSPRKSRRKSPRKSPKKKMGKNVFCCFKCKKNRVGINIKKVGRRMAAVCKKCGCKMSKFVKA